MTSQSLIVTNIPEPMTQLSLNNLVSKYATPQHVQVVARSSNSGKQVALIDCSSLADANLVRNNLDGHVWLGETMVVRHNLCHLYQVPQSILANFDKYILEVGIDQ
jgi:hypothetical protein